MEVLWRSIPAGCVAVAVACGSWAAEPVVVDLAPGQTWRTTVVVAPGDAARALIRRQGVAPGVRLVDADGRVLSEVEGHSDRGQVVVSSVIAASGGVTVEITAPPDDGGEVAVEVERLDADDPHLGALLAADSAFRAAQAAQAQATESDRRAAVELFQEARAGYAATGRAELEARMWEAAGRLHLDLGEPERAAAAFTEALEDFEALGIVDTAATLRGHLGNVALSLGHAEEALQHFQAAHATWVELGNLRFQASMLSNLGNTHASLGDFEAAAEHLARSLPLRQEAGDLSGEIYTLLNLGLLNRRLGRLDEAVAFAEPAVAIARRLGDPLLLRKTLYGAGVIRHARGDDTGSEAALREGLEIARQQGAHRDRALLLVNLARTLESLGRWDEALRAASRSAELFADHAGPRQQADALLVEAGLLLRIGETGQAADRFGRAADLFKTSNAAPAEAGAWESAAAAATALEDHHGAERSWRRAVAVYERIGEPQRLAGARLGLASVQADAGDHKAALATIDLVEAAAVEAGDRPLLARAAVLEARLRFASGDIQGTVSSARRALETADGARLTAAWAHHWWARAVAAGDDVRQALALNQRALEGVESLRSTLGDEYRSAFAGTVHDIYALQIDLLMRSGAAEQALEIRERAAARSLVESLGRAGVKELPAAPADLAGIRAMLDPGTVLLEFAVGDSGSWVWVITGDSLSWCELPPAETLAADVRRALDGIAAGDDADGVLSGLADHVLACVPSETWADAVAGARLVVIPDGPLHLLPFAALPWRGRPLVDRAEVVVLPSAGALAAVRARDPQRRHQLEIAVLADPVFRAADQRVVGLEGVPQAAVERGGWERLRFSREEAQSIAALFDEDERLVALDFEASRETALAVGVGSARIVHLATHGVIDAGDPRRCAIILSQVDRRGRPVEGTLRLVDLWRMDLAADLVVLSGCDTARGRLVRGEGMIGLTQGFLQAGADTVVASLWAVRDRAATEFMTSLYGAMVDDGLRPAAALRAAQRTLADRGRPARDWAGFVVQGEWR
jgi:CHAT domain-containing protein/tetratricopeptide (TPR) repeat protein